MNGYLCGRLTDDDAAAELLKTAAALLRMGYAGPAALEAFASGDVDKALEAFRNAFTL